MYYVAWRQTKQNLAGMADGDRSTNSPDYYGLVKLLNTSEKGRLCRYHVQCNKYLYVI